MMTMFGTGLWGGFMMILFWGVVIYLIVWIVKNISGNNIQNKSSRQILEERYAKGEIDKKEFEEKNKDLN